jgi:hypothetical protein
MFAKDNLDRCAGGEHMSGGDQFEDGAPPDGLSIEDVLPSFWYPRVKARERASDIENDFHVRCLLLINVSIN